MPDPSSVNPPPAPASAPAVTRIYDAAFIPVGWDPAPGTGASSDRPFRVTRCLKPLFGGRDVWVHAQNPVFVSTDPPPKHTIFFPTNHPLEGQPRYTWEDGPLEGLRLGTLVPEAREQAKP